MDFTVRESILTSKVAEYEEYFDVILLRDSDQIWRRENIPSSSWESMIPRRYLEMERTGCCIFRKCDGNYNICISISI